MSSYLSLAGAPTATWLTAVLRQAGHLASGTVERVTARASGAFNSRTSFLQVAYSEAESTLPTSFVLKQNGTDAWSQAAGAVEVRFYQTVAALADHPRLTVPCYAAAHDASSGESYLLLADLSATHAPPVTRAAQIARQDGVPAKMVIGAVVDTLAQLHAYWWQHPLLHEDTFVVGHWSRDEHHFARYLDRRRRAWERLHAQEQQWFPAELRQLYEQILSRLHGYWEAYLWPRFQLNQQLTLVHGDAYFANFLTPKSGGAGHTYLLDWQSPTFDLGAYDLVNLCATFWDSQQRNQLDREMSMLQRYHHGLLRHGTTHYSWDQLLTDYRSGLIFWLLMPVQDGADGAPRGYWWPKMQCLLAAFQEWECAELLGIA